jgi:hypothetical protein
VPPAGRQVGAQDAGQHSERVHGDGHQLAGGDPWR